MRALFLGWVIGIGLLTVPTSGFANDDLCSTPREPFRGYWWGGRMLVQQQLARVPLLFMGRFSYRENRSSLCYNGMPVLPPSVGEADVSIALPIVNNRRGGWLVGMAAQGQGSQKPGESIRGMVTGAPSTSGHINVWGTPIPLIQFTGAITSMILPDADFPISVAYLGGVRLYPMHRKHVQTNVGLTIGGSNANANFIPSFALRGSDFILFNRRIALGAEIRTPISLFPGSLPYSWRFWGAFTVAVEEVESARPDRRQPNVTTRPSQDLVRSASENAPPTQTAWETPL